MNDLDVAVEASAAAAGVLRRLFGTNLPAHYKGPIDPVTAADEAAEEALLAVIRRERPADSILSEEGGGGTGTSDRSWVVDPMDGTVNFVNGIPHIAVSVGLWEGNSPLVGVIRDVLRDEVFTAVRGSGAFMNGGAIHVTDKTHMKRAVFATGYPYDHREHAAAYGAVTSAVLQHVQGIRRFGSAALDLAWTAAGRYDGYFELGVAPWDMAAGTLLVTEAGGVVTDPRGHAPTLATALIVAANPAFHEQLRQTVVGNMPLHIR